MPTKLLRAMQFPRSNLAVFLEEQNRQGVSVKERHGMLIQHRLPFHLPSPSASASRTLCPLVSSSLLPRPVAFEPMQLGCLVLQQVTHAGLWRLGEERHPKGKEKKFSYCRGG